MTLRLKDIAQNVEDQNNPIRELFTASNETLKISKDQLLAWQKGIFSSCWYLTEGNTNHHESLAMRNLYEDKNSFVI